MADNKSGVVPTQFSLVQVFHAVASYTFQDGQWRHRPEFCTATLSAQVERWVRTTQSRVVMLSSPSLVVVDGMLDGQPAKEHRMSMAVGYERILEEIYDPERRQGSSPEAWFPPVVKPA